MAIVVDQATLGGASRDASGATMAFTTSATVASGAFIVAACGWIGDGTSVTGVTNSGSDLGWTVDLAGADHPGDPDSRVAVARAQVPSGLGSGTTVTFTFDNADGAVFTVSGLSFTGVATSSPLDGTPPAAAGVSSPGSTAWATNASTVAAGSVLVGVSWQESGIASGGTVTGPATEAHERLDTDDFYGHVVGYQVVGSGGSYSMAGTWAANAVSVSVQVAYLAAAVEVPAVTLHIVV